MKKSMKVIACCLVVLFSNNSFAQLQEVLMLSVSSGTHSDQTAVRFLHEATDGFDSQYDAYKFDNPGMTPNLFTVSDERYAINALCSSFDEKTVLLYFRAAFSGSYTIHAEEIGAFDSTWSITLVDKELNTASDMRMGEDYVFPAQKGEADNRFVLQFKVEHHSIVTSAADAKAEADALIYSYGENILIPMESETGSVCITDMLGYEVFNAALPSGKGSVWSFSPGKQGMYIVSLLRNNKRYYKKVYVSSNVVL